MVRMRASIDVSDKDNPYSYFKEEWKGSTGICEYRLKGMLRKLEKGPFKVVLASCIPAMDIIGGK
jgi:hypothetical protein